MEKLFIAKFLIYETPSEEAKGKFSAGLVVANRLNGNGMLVGTFNGNKNESNPRKVGFVTFREKFETLEQAQEFKKEHSRQFPVGSNLNPKEWAWGEVDEDSTSMLETNGAVIHFVEFIGHDSLVPTTSSPEEEKREMQFKGKVTEPVS